MKGSVKNRKQTKKKQKKGVRNKGQQMGRVRNEKKKYKKDVMNENNKREVQ